MRKVAESILTECGYTTIQAENGKIALDIFGKHYKEIKVVLLDLLMPEMSGKETFMEMKKIDPEVKVILVSGFSMDKRIEDMIELGINDFIQKPYTIEKVARSLTKLNI